MILGKDKDTRTDLPPGISVHMMVLDPPIDRLAALVTYLMPFVDEFVIVDTGSKPGTVQKMRDWTFGGSKEVRIHETKFADFSTTRNEGLALHRYEWTLGIDPDEMPSWAMMAHIRYVTSKDGMEAAPLAKGWVYWTYNFWDGILGPQMDYHWHTRLWKTYKSYLYRPIHELVIVQGTVEGKLRGTSELPAAPMDCHLIHSKGGKEIEEADELYAKMGEDSK
jgi:hypothetical protein